MIKIFLLMLDLEISSNKCKDSLKMHLFKKRHMIYGTKIFKHKMKNQIFANKKPTKIHPRKFNTHISFISLKNIFNKKLNTNQFRHLSLQYHKYQKFSLRNNKKIN